jgi:lipopolysaccharide transport system ATP-binding protein
MTVITISNLSKKYKRYHNQWGRLLEFITLGSVQAHDPHWVLKGISLKVDKGESLGIVGINGSGKTSLLKILAKVTPPSEGNFVTQGEVSAILGLGTAFHPLFNGYQNAAIGCYLRGFNKGEVEKWIPKILDFSELGDSMRDPIRTYSSGMKMRLAFAVATAKRPDVLIIDEALAVGDAHFRQKCLARINEYKAQGTALLFVSHSMEMVKSFCERIILLDKGRVLGDGPTKQILAQYNQLIYK